jgi:hypothetical protein
MLNDLRWVAPLPQPILEVLVAYELTREFHREVQCREEFEQYCQWYREVSARHQLEMQKMQGDINLFGWFNQLGRR